MDYDFELRSLMRRAQAAFDALTPDEKARHRRAQAISWVVGQLQCSTNHRWDDEWALRLWAAKDYDGKH
jgi:hypothetical protein